MSKDQVIESYKRKIDELQRRLDKMAQATDYLVLEGFHQYENVWYALVGCPDYDAWKKLPEVIRTSNNLLLGKTGWNSDTGRGYYNSNVIVGWKKNNP